MFDGQSDSKRTRFCAPPPQRKFGKLWRNELKLTFVLFPRSDNFGLSGNFETNAQKYQFLTNRIHTPLDTCAEVLRCEHFWCFDLQKAHKTLNCYDLSSKRSKYFCHHVLKFTQIAQVVDDLTSNFAEYVTHSGKSNRLLSFYRDLPNFWLFWKINQRETPQLLEELQSERTNKRKYGFCSYSTEIEQRIFVVNGNKMRKSSK